MATKLTLTDIGKYDVAQNYPDGATDERAYGTNGSEGAALNLNAHEITVQYVCGLDLTPATMKKKSNTSTNRFEWGEVDKTSIEFPMWTIKCTFDSTSESSMQDYGRLIHMYKTKGYKTLGWSADTGCEILTYNQYGEREKDGESTKTVTSINVRIDSITPKQVFKKGYKVEVSIKLVQTG